MRKLRWAIAAMLSVAPSVAVAQSSQPTTAPATRPAETQPATRPAVIRLGDPAELLRELADADWHVRRQTEQRLVDGGEDARPFILELIQQATNDEARKNAQAALAQIDQNRLLGPSFITLHVKDASPAIVFAEISRQCFAPLQTVPDNLLQEQGFANITLDIDHEPFWKVMPQICQKLGVDFRPSQTGMRIMRSGGMQVGPVSVVQGPFLVIATQITYSRTKSLMANHGDQSQFGLNLSVYAEPKVNVLRGNGAIEVDEVTDDHGNSLLPDGDRGRRNFGGFAGFGGWSLYAPLHYPKQNPGSKIAKFKGTTVFVVQTESQKIELPDLLSLKHVTQLVHDTAVTFEEMKKNNDNWQLRVRVAQPNFGSAEWQQLIEGLQNRMKVLDADGNALDHRGMSTSANNASLDLTLDFARSNRADGKLSGPPSRLVWEVPTRTRDITVPIEFTDIPLFDDK